MAGSMKAEKEPGFVQRALSGHAAIGLLAGALLYLVCLSGILAVLQGYFQRWEQPGIAEMTVISPQAVQRAFEGTLAQQGKTTTHAYVQMPTEGLPRTVVTTDHGAVFVDSNGEIQGADKHSWTELVLYLHYYLNLPPIGGMLLTAALGAMMCAAAVTGILAHPRIFRDAFRMRLRGRAQLGMTDLHNRFGVWLLPFVLALGFTGAMIGLGQIVMQSIAVERYAGHIEDAYAPIFGEHPKEDNVSAPLARTDRALAWMAENRPHNAVTFITVEAPGTRGQLINVIAEHDKRLIYGDNYRFDAEGRYLGSVGISDGPLGQQAIGSLYKVHFGNFGGVPIELAYVIFGVALCVIVGTGTRLWLMKRRARGTPSPRLEAHWTLTVWGSPLVLVLTYWVRAVAGPDMPLTAIFWGMLVVGTVANIAIPLAFEPRPWRIALGIAMALTGIGHAIAVAAPPLSSVLIDMALMLSGAGLALSQMRIQRRSPAVGAVPEPAE